MSPPQVDSPHRPTRRSRRPPRKSAVSGPSHIPSMQDAEISTEASPKRDLEKPIRILRRGEHEVAPEDPPHLNLHPLPPRTPPRPRSMCEGSVSRQFNGNDSAPEISQTKTRTPKNQGRKHSGAASPMQFLNGTPVSTPRTQSLTPGRMNQIPAKAYAGPTFHASPAASSLPIPKFFSRSVPNVDKTISLKAMMQQEASQTASESEDSPPQENKQPARDHRTREESPLDIFFQADREAKARSGSSAKDMNFSDNQAHLSALLSAPHTPPSHHSRQPTDDSVGGIFCLEMDGRAAEHSSGLERDLTGLTSDQRDMSFPTTEAERKEEQRKAQTAALKQLIHSPRPHLPHNGSSVQRPPSSSLRKEVLMPSSPEQVHVPDDPGTPTPSRVHKTYTQGDVRAQSHQDGYTSSYTPIRPFNRSSNSTPTSNNVKAKSMEDDLRRILKLDVLGEGVAPIRS